MDCGDIHYWSDNFQKWMCTSGRRLCSEHIHHDPCIHCEREKHEVR